MTIELFIRSAINSQVLLNDWMWLLKEPHEVLLVTAMGDAFVADKKGRVSFLDTLEGSLSVVAPSRESFFSLMNSGEQDPDWFNPDMLALKVSQPLLPGQCFSYQVAPILGGSLDTSNVQPMDVYAHFTIYGQLHRQLRNLPRSRIAGFRVVE